MDSNDNRTRLHLALLEAEGLTTEDVGSISVLIDAGEEFIALETLCTQIYEYDVELNDAQRGELDSLGASLGVPVSYLLGDPWADSPGGCGSGG